MLQNNGWNRFEVFATCFFMNKEQYYSWIDKFANELINFLRK